MSDRVSWVPCPWCGEPSAVGWRSIEDEDGDVVGEVWVELDCPQGCQITQPNPEEE